MINCDLFANVDRRAAANAAFSVLDALQRFSPEHRIVGLTAAFVLLAEHLGVRPLNVFEIVSNVMRDAMGRRPEFAAIEQYLKNEL